MGVIEEVRQDREDLARVLKKHTGIRKLVEDLYPDSAHFIYELLQNAEDTGATEVTFRLEEKSLFFEHNGRPFEPQDIYAITDIGEGTKGIDDDKIGRFGVGFKAVFAYSETPLIWSPTYSFKISELVLPFEIESREGTTTRFEFPFDNPKKTPEDAYIEIKSGLEELAETTLLFLSDMESIHWQIGGCPAGEVLRIEHSANHVEVLKQVDGKKTTSSHFLRFSEPVVGLAKQEIAIAFELDFLPEATGFDSQIPLFKQLKILPADPGRVAVYFPAVKEASGLRFHLHGPFVPELSRASIKETPANTPLFKQIAGLAASSLYTIRELKLLTGEFLGVLPNTQDAIPKRYERIRAAIIDEMNQNPLTPTYLKDHAAAQDLLQGKASLKSLLTEEDLKFLIDYDDASPMWSIGAPQKNTNVDRFLNCLNIKPWDIDKFVELIRSKASTNLQYLPSSKQWIVGTDSDFMDWLATKKDAWHQKLYALLHEDFLVGHDYKKRQLAGQLKNLKIVRLNDGTYSVGSECFFPGSGTGNDKLLPRVSRDVFSSGRAKNQQESAYGLLEAIGVRDVGIAEEVEAILKKRYSKSKNKLAKRTYIRDLKKFMSFLAEEHGDEDLFDGYHIFKADDERWVTPNEVALDTPFISTGLKAFCDAIGEENELNGLSHDYLNYGISVEKFVKFAKSVGARTDLEFHNQSTKGHPFKDELRKDYYHAYVRLTNTAIDRDWFIPHLSKSLKTPSVDLFELIWRSMSNSDPKVLKAKFRPNKQYPTREQPSSLVFLLMKKRLKWVPQEDGKFVSPVNASFEKLPKGYKYDENSEWLKAIKFGDKVLQLSEERKKVQAAAKELLGTDDANSVEDAIWFVGLTEDERQDFKEEYLRRHPTELPENEPGNPNLRNQRVGDQAGNAPGRTSEQRTRTVSTGLGEIKQAAEQYLRQQYTNSDGEMICQVCKKNLPFKLSDGRYYVEKVELLKELQRRHLQNYLALCPNHAAMFQHANGSRDLLKDMVVELDGNHLEVVLADQNASIYFTKTHIADLITVIENDANAEA
mgnify:CR=1 FL=1